MEIDPEIVAKALQAGRLIVPLFSPRSAEILARQLPKDVRPVIVAISQKTADAWDRPAAQFLVADAPNAGAILDLTRRVLDSDSPS